MWSLNQKKVSGVILALVAVSALTGLHAVASNHSVHLYAAAEPSPPPPDQPTPMPPPTPQPQSRPPSSDTSATISPWTELGMWVGRSQSTIEADGVQMDAAYGQPAVTQAEALATLAQNCTITAAPAGAAYAHVTLTNGTPGGITISQDAWVFSFDPQFFTTATKTPAWDLWFVGITNAPHNSLCFGMGGGPDPA